MIRNPRVRQPLAALLLGLTLGGCQSWRVEPGNSSQVIAQFPRHAIRVQKRDGEVLEIDAPKVVDDSIRGLVHCAPADSSAPVVLRSRTCADWKRGMSIAARHFSRSELLSRFHSS